jgi:AraC-like DNA-binding protein
MFVCLFWLVAFIAAWKKAYWAKKAMVPFFAAATMLYACHFLYFSGNGSPVFETIYGVMNLSVYPFFFLYLTTLAGDFPKKGWWLFAPAAVIAVAYPVCFAEGWMNAQYYFYVLARACFACQILVVWILGSKKLKMLKAQLDDYFTDDRSAELRTLNILLWFFGVTAVFSAVWTVMGREMFADSVWLILPSLLMSVLLYALGYTAFVLPDPLKGMDACADPMRQKDVPDDFLSEEDAIIIGRLNRLMKEKKTYLRSDITIADIALLVGTNRSYLSAAINHTYAINFSQYINQLRVEEAKLVLADKSYSVDKEAIADAMIRSGFTNDKTFYRVFKEYTGETPLQYRRLITS